MVRQVLNIVPTNRLKARRVDESSLIAEAVKSAKADGKPCIMTDHGGTVANSYGSEADTEICLVVAFPNGDYYAEVKRLPANKTTFAGAAAFIFSESRPLFDNRIRDKVKIRKARELTIQWAEHKLEPNKVEAPLSEAAKAAKNWEDWTRGPFDLFEEQSRVITG